MKKTIYYLALISILLLSTASSCTDDEPTEIPTGDHTFSCYIDGELFVPYQEIDWNPGGGDSDGLSIYIYDNFFAAYARYFETTTVYLNIGAEWGVGTFNLADSNGWITEDSHEINHAIVINNGIKYLSKEGSGSITVTESYYPESGGVKGTFEFTLYNENDDTDTIHVTNGKFDD